MIVGVCGMYSVPNASSLHSLHSRLAHTTYQVQQMPASAQQRAGSSSVPHSIALTRAGVRKLGRIPLRRASRQLRATHRAVFPQHRVARDAVAREAVHRSHLVVVLRIDVGAVLDERRDQRGGVAAARHAAHCMEEREDRKGAESQRGGREHEVEQIKSSCTRDSDALCSGRAPPVMTRLASRLR